MRKPSRVARLLAEFRRRHEAVEEVQKIRFRGTEGLDVYNITSPFEIDGIRFLAGRVEARETEFSQVWFFQEVDGFWVRVEQSPRLDLQDPFWTRIDGELIVGGVEISTDASHRITGWRTVFHRGRSLNTLMRFFEGPWGMKDLRLCPLLDGRIAVFTRPQGRVGGRGKIGFRVVSSLEALSIPLLEKAPLLPFFRDDEWGGVNQAWALDARTIAALGHVARFSPGGIRHYYPMVFTLDLVTGQPGPMKIVAERRKLLPGPTKRPDLVDVLFPGGLELEADGRAVLYLGVSDAEAQTAKVHDPFQGLRRVP